MSKKEAIAAGEGKYLLYRMTEGQVGLWLGDERYSFWADRGALVVLKREPEPWESEEYKVSVGAEVNSEGRRQAGSEQKSSSMAEGAPLLGSSGGENDPGPPSSTKSTDCVDCYIHSDCCGQPCEKHDK